MSYDEFFSEFYKKEFIFIDCNSKLYKTYLKSVINDSLDKWKGHPIYVNAKRECFVLKCIIDLDEFDNSIKLAPELLIGLEK